MTGWREALQDLTPIANGEPLELSVSSGAWLFTSQCHQYFVRRSLDCGERGWSHWADFDPVYVANFLPVKN